MYVDDVRSSEFSYAYLTLILTLMTLMMLILPLLLYLHTCIDVYTRRVPLSSSFVSLLLYIFFFISNEFQIDFCLANSLVAS